MLVKDVMHRNVEWVDPGLTIRDAAQMMRDQQIGCLPVGENDRVVGMVTDRDICCRAVAEGRDPSTPVREVMSQGITWVFEDQDLSEAAQVMEEKQLHRLPIMSREKRMVGMLAFADLGLHAPHELAGEVLEAVSRPAAH